MVSNPVKLMVNCLYGICCKLFREEILKYKNIIIGIQLGWNVKAKVILVIIGATGTISESLRQYLSNILGKHYL
jgi:hypothetical protein